MQQYNLIHTRPLLCFQHGMWQKKELTATIRGQTLSSPPKKEGFYICLTYIFYTILTTAKVTDAEI